MFSCDALRFALTPALSRAGGFWATRNLCAGEGARRAFALFLSCDPGLRKLLESSTGWKSGYPPPPKLVGMFACVALRGAWILTRFLASLLYGVGVTDALTFTAVPLVMLGAGLLACLVPARRAANVDPASILREE